MRVISLCCLLLTMACCWHVSMGNTIVPSIASKLRRFVSMALFSPVGQSQSAASIMPVNTKKTGVLLLNLGGPETQRDVQGFLYNLFADPDIIQLPCSFLRLFQKPLAYAISRGRAPKSAQAYQRIGGGSPIGRYTKAQSNLLEQELKLMGINASCQIAMRYWHPYTDEALSKLEQDKIDELVVLPLYPQYSVSTTASSLKALQAEFSRSSRSGWSKIPYTVVADWYRRPDYIQAMADLILKELAKCSVYDTEKGVHVLFSAHGVPESYVKAGDPYRSQMCDCVNLIASKVRDTLNKNQEMSSRLFGRPLSVRKELFVVPSEAANNCVSNTAKSMEDWSISNLGKSIDSHKKDSVHFHLSFQSRVGPVQWLRPYTDDIIKQLGSAGVNTLMVVPISFVSEHIETLEEIDIEYRELAEESGIHNWKRVPALNTEPAFIKCLANTVNDALHAPRVDLASTIISTRKKPLWRRLLRL